MSSEPLIINDVTGLNPVAVWAVAAPRTVEEVQEALRRSNGPVSVGGGRFSMGGQTASPGSLHLDMRRLNGIVRFSPLEKTIRVQAGIRWCDIQRFIDPHGLSVKVMQTYANFTVGGSLSVNCHGRYIGLGPVILSVLSLSVVLADGSRVEASPGENADLFYGIIGGYGGLGVIVEADLSLAENCRVERVHTKLPLEQYPGHFRAKVRDSGRAVFHNADIYPPHYERVRSVSWMETDKPVTVPHRLMRLRRAYPLEKYVYWLITETFSGKWRREFIVDPLVMRRTRVHWRNYEAGYDVAELEPASRRRTTFVLQEYFTPVERIGEFVPRMAEILRRHRVNVVNVSIRHAGADPGSLLAWARGETFAYVLYHKQRTRENARNRVAVWTRELIEAVIDCGGTYYLPYQPHATAAQFHRAYPRARELFTLKNRLDPGFRLRNVIWDTYYAPTLRTEAPNQPMTSEFQSVFSTAEGSDRVYLFLQNIFHLYPEDRLHAMIRRAAAEKTADEAVYREIQEKLPEVKPFLSELTYALPALRTQKREMARQALELLGNRREVDGYIEIGTTGRYYSRLRRDIRFRGDFTLVNDAAPTNSPADLMERSGFRQPARFVPLNDYDPIPAGAVPDGSAELVTCFIGLHHAAPEKLDAFVRSIQRVLRPGGLFILRDHDAATPEMKTYVSLIHTIFNAGLGVPWEVNQREPRHFNSLNHWSGYLAARGFRDDGRRLYQAHDPSLNALMVFNKDVS